MIAPDLSTCGCCGNPIPAFTDASLRYAWDRGHEDAKIRRDDDHE